MHYWGKFSPSLQTSTSATSAPSSSRRDLSVGPSSHTNTGFLNKQNLQLKLENNREKMRAVVTGGTGLVGSKVCEILSAQGWEVIVLSRNPSKCKILPGVQMFQWDGHSGKNWAHLLNCDTVLINLAGENPGTDRWTDTVKDRLLKSRLSAIAAVGEAVSISEARGIYPLAWVQASAVGAYGNRGEETLTDAATVGEGDDFRTVCCKVLEAAAFEQGTKTHGKTPVTVFRLGHVLSSEGGLLPHMNLGSFFRGSALGNGKQYVPWVHIEDAAGAIAFVCDQVKVKRWDHNQKTVNIAAPKPVSNREFMRTLATIRQRRGCVISVPAFALRVVVGESSSVVLDSQRVLPTTLQEMGFVFRFPDLSCALASEECL